MSKTKNLTYLQQIRRLRKLAEKALLNYPIKFKKLIFINHGENTTYKAIAKNNKAYLLRIHRNDYHTLPALNEELKWIKKLNQKSDLMIQKPILSKNGKLVTTVSTDKIGARPCSLLTWTQGPMKHSRHTIGSFQKVGELIALLHKPVSYTHLTLPTILLV